MQPLAEAAVQAAKGIREQFNNRAPEFLATLMAQPHFNIQTTSEVREIFTSTEELSGFKKTGRKETPAVVTLGDGYRVDLSDDRYTSALELDSTSIKRENLDTSEKIGEYLAEQSAAIMRNARNTVVRNAYEMLNEGHDAGSDFLAPDGVELFGAHSWNSGDTFDNSTTNKFDEDAYDIAEEYAGEFTMAEGQEAPLNWSHIVVKKGSREAFKEAKKLFASEIKATAVGDVNIYQGGEVTIISTPHILPANRNHWSLFDLTEGKMSPLYVGMGMFPTMDEPLRLENMGIRSNVEAFWKKGVNNMPYNLYGSDGTV